MGRSNIIEFNQLKDYVFQSHKSHSHSQRVFYKKAFNLHETTLKVIILIRKENFDESLALQVNKYIDFIKQAR